MVREFYASYVATLRGLISNLSKPIAQDPLTSTIFWGCPVDISHATISLFLYGPTTDRLCPHAAGRDSQEGIQTFTTYPFLCLIFQLCRDSGVPIWHCDKLIRPIRDEALDISLIRNGANVAAPRREPQVEVPPLGADLADTVGQAQGGDPIIPDHSDTVPASSFQATSMAPSSSRVQKLEAQMATLLHHIQPWMQKSIAKSEAIMERRMECMMDRKVQAINKHLNAFELRAALASLQADVDAILATPIVEPQASPTALADDTMLDALFSGTAEEEPVPTIPKNPSKHT
ncbi:hypothetical protein H5410_023184 [Solanum commersonii]|uniref:Integrase core domain containing protein n=1 Tax=Solanum commersonii TaxID=4109 RepID=A0A9J5ZIL4_SOLCO|nr:hypothetical protein H5410_023184 [Solanum commersonii]